LTCFFPIEAFRVEGQSKLVFAWPKGGQYLERLQVPCGQCIGCRLERSRQWAIRCIHEAQMHRDNCFITLTYAPEHLPKNGGLQLHHFQKFMKRLRKKYGSGIRFFHCGEYGEQFGRPHYHACLFGFDFPDKVLHTIINGFKLYRSRSLEELWPFGFATIGSVTFESSAYVARYILKKVTGEAATLHYCDIDPDGVITNERAPEYITMSRRPGIAAGWFERFCGDVYPSDGVVVRGRKMRPPRYYDKLYAERNPVMFEGIQYERWLSAQNHLDNQTDERLAVRHEVQKARLRKLPRNLE